MGAWGAIPALLLPMIVGGMIAWRCLPVCPRDARWCVSAAVGLQLGLLLTGVATALTAALSPSASLGVVTGVLAAAGAAAFAVRRRAAGVPPMDDGPGRVLAWVLIPVALIVLANVALMVGEVLERPLLGWDAWRVWAVRPLIWQETSAAVEFTGAGAWISATDPALFTVPGHHYPELVGRFQLWTARWIGGWDDAGVFLAWPVLWVSLLAGFFGFARIQGAGRVTALCATGLLAAAPFPAVHGVLPGYMDLWIAAQVLAIVGLLTTWLDSRHPALLVLAAIVAVAMAMTKVEGFVWAVVIAVSFALATRPPKQVARVLGIGVVVVAVWALGGGIGWEFGGVELALRPDRIALPYLGIAELSYENRLGAFATALLSLPNWHVLAGLLVASLALLVTRSWPPLRLATGLFLLCSALFLGLLFNLTPAGYWADDLTASNRLTLHVFPAGLWLLLATYVRDLREASASA